jgi:hypothetical protein
MSGCLDEIRNWKLEAKFEDTERYFYEFAAVEKLLVGERFFVIGRKGTGKTAISEFIRRMQRHDTFSEKLTFKNFPFNELYSRPNAQYTMPNQYISLWKYIIYSFICRLMSKNEGIDPEISASLSEIYAIDSKTNLQRMIHRWTASEFSISAFGTGGKIAKTRNANPASWVDKCDILEDVIREYCDKSTYYIIFDELDEDYKEMIATHGKSEYISLVTSLFKAAMDVRQSLAGLNVFPIVFLRDDIYDLVQDSDKNKWNDFRIDLEWKREHIQRLLSFRISRAANPPGPILPFDEAWSTAFEDASVRFGFRQKKKIESFDYIARSTLMRPRDFIRYLQVCAESDAREGHDRISPETVRREDKSFSNYLRNEIEDEVHGVLPDISGILDTLAHLRKPIFNIQEFRNAYKERLANGAVQTPDAELVLQILLHFSVIGNRPKQKLLEFFKFSNKEARFNSKEDIIVHRGLYKSLQII